MSRDVVRFVEIDVAVTSDGELILSHDLTLDRTTTGSGLISELRLTDLRSIDAGVKYSPVFTGEPVPTLNEALQAISGRALPIIEAKSGAARVYAEALKSSGFPAEGLVTSMSMGFLEAFKAVMPEVKLGWIGSNRLTSGDFERAKRLGVAAYLWPYDYIDSEMVQSVRENGALVYAWTIPNESVAMRMIAAGVDGLIVDSPTRFSSSLGLGRPPTIAPRFAQTTIRAAVGSEIVLRGEFDTLSESLEWFTDQATRLSHDAVVAVEDAKNSVYRGVIRRPDGGSEMFNIAVAPEVRASEFRNLSMRVRGPSRSTNGIVGFFLAGAAQGGVRVRTLGPSLANYGVQGHATAVGAELFNSSGESLALAEIEQAASDAVSRFLGLGSLLPGDAGLVRALSTGAYTAHARNLGDRTGEHLIEVFSDTPLKNISGRAIVVQGGSAILGFSVEGGASKNVLIRALGPALAKFAVGDALKDPRLALFDAQGNLLANARDVHTASDLGRLGAIAARVGAFPLPSNSRDAALVLPLLPGAYTLVVSADAPGMAGTVVVEVFGF
jgi:glycerophosphoryl diester phosphodiesterase